MLRRLLLLGTILAAGGGLAAAIAFASALPPRLVALAGGPGSPTPTVTPTPTLTPGPWTMDSDVDGCNDAEELAPDPGRGGRRDPTNFWDFFDTPDDANVRDKTIDLFGDIVGVIRRFGADDDNGSAPINRNTDPLSPPPPAPAYHPAFDRSAPPSGGDRWDLGPADGVIDLFTDIVGIITQYGHSCAGPATAILATFDVVGERFIAHVLNPSTIAQILALEQGESSATIPVGRLRAGTGYNAGWSWHTDPWETTMAEVTIEVCDGLPSHVEADLDYWLNIVGSYCPWSAQLVQVGYLP